VGAHDYDRPGKPGYAWDDPDARQALVSGLVGDALRLLAAVTDLELDDEQADAVALLALVAGQDVEAGQRPGTWRIARWVAHRSRKHRSGGGGGWPRPVPRRACAWR
jgi:hypothetical protein